MSHVTPPAWFLKIGCPNSRPDPRLGQMLGWALGFKLHWAGFPCLASGRDGRNHYSPYTTAAPHLQVGTISGQTRNKLEALRIGLNSEVVEQDHIVVAGCESTTLSVNSS
eukprot:9372874-Pyramimonas_sp.AAC.1